MRKRGVTIISVVLLSFMVQEPSEIMLCTSDKSLFSSVFMYRTMLVSDWYLPTRAGVTRAPAST